jgi:hypothetical protein
MSNEKCVQNFGGKPEGKTAFGRSRHKWENDIKMNKKYEDVKWIHLKMTVLWDVAPCSLVEVYQRFRGACRFHHQSDHRLSSEKRTGEIAAVSISRSASAAITGHGCKHSVLTLVSS